MLPAEAATEEQLFDVAVGAGAEEVEQIGQSWVITTPKEQLDEIRGALDGAEIEVSSADLEMLPKNRKTVEGRDAENLMNLVDELEDHDDVQKVFTDFDIAEQELERLST